MTEKAYTISHLLSDAAIEKEIGLFVKQMRQQENKTQAEIAKAANISRSTLSLLEQGESGNLKTLIKVLRVLKQLQVLAGFKYEKPISPLALAKAQHKPRARVRKSRTAKSTGEKKSSW